MAKVKGMTMDELEQFIEHKVMEILGHPDSGLQLNPEFRKKLESRLKKIREMYFTIPTLSPGIEWVPDESMGDGVFKVAHPEVRHRTEKTVQHKIIVAATKEHPAQVEKWNENVPVGNFITTRWYSMLSPAEKSRLISRIDILLQAVKKARQRANSVDVVKMNIGETIKNFIHKK